MHGAISSKAVYNRLSKIILTPAFKLGIGFEEYSHMPVFEIFTEQQV